ncbi:MAG: S-methyl-5'-thioadenosine phosphorylase [Candidatus Dormibacteraeota bacterium]|nr:S-methyl-5'-thioadenosine phosphorylase [Candidatus Dormibacteraeota bacterium]
MTRPQARIGVIGGSGLYRLLDDAEAIEMDTPFGRPSDRIAVGVVAGVPVAFVPRHGGRHTLPPAAINYRANLWALRELGVTRVLGPAAAGSLQAHVRRGDLVVCDQFVDRTHGRADTFYRDGPEVAHVAAPDPYCPELRALAMTRARELGFDVHERGTVVVIQGPRFSTRAESRWFSAMGWEVVNMTQYPEAILARELQLCYVNISLITDYDAGLEGDADAIPVSVQDVERFFAESMERVRQLILALVPAIPEARSCPCAAAMQGAFIGA